MCRQTAYGNVASLQTLAGMYAEKGEMIRF